MPPSASAVIAVTTVICLSGCQYTNWNGPAGPLNQQHAIAAVHDPFPQADLGPSDGSMRPPSYQQPLPEAVRNQIGPDSMPWLGQ